MPPSPSRAYICEMKAQSVLLVSATAAEIAPFLAWYRESKPRLTIDFLVTGIGLTAATYSIAKQIQLKRPSLIIQAGIAGSFDSKLSHGSVVVVKQDTIADLSVVEGGKLRTMFDLGLSRPGALPFKKGRLVNPHKELIRASGFKPVNAISVNHISTGTRMIAMYREAFNPAIESMEGAALHYVALMEQLPFLQVRAISNYIGERNKSKWSMKPAIESLNNSLISLVKTILPNDSN